MPPISSFSWNKWDTYLLKTVILWYARFLNSQWLSRTDTSWRIWRFSKRMIMLLLSLSFKDAMSIFELRWPGSRRIMQSSRRNKRYVFNFQTFSCASFSIYRFIKFINFTLKGDFKAQALSLFQRSQPGLNFDKKMKKLWCNFPKAKQWIEWWHALDVKAMLFKSRPKKMDNNGLCNDIMPATNNAQESLHQVYYMIL